MMLKKFNGIFSTPKLPTGNFSDENDLLGYTELSEDLECRKWKLKGEVMAEQKSLSKPKGELPAYRIFDSEAQDKQVGAIWRNEAKSGLTYLSIKLDGDTKRYVGFYNKFKEKGKPEDEKKPDYRVIESIPNSKEGKNIGGMWKNTNRVGEAYLRLKMNDKSYIVQPNKMYSRGEPRK